MSTLKSSNATIYPLQQRTMYHHHRVCIFISNSKRSLTTKSPSRPSSLLVTANYGDAYAPLEQAISLINRVISATASSKRAPPTNQDDKEEARWVQLRSVTNQYKTISTNTNTTTSTTEYSLSDYLSLPVDQYSLLDPKWISRIDNNAFLIQIPFSDLLGVDLTPEIQINIVTPGGRRIERRIGSINNSSYSSKEEDADDDDGDNDKSSSRSSTYTGVRALGGGNGGARVVFEGSNAKLGNPELDSAFKLNLTAVVGEHKKRWDPPPLPGRPVYRLKKWAAARNEAAREESSNSDVDDGGDRIVVEGEGEDNSSSIAHLLSDSDIDNKDNKNEEKLFCRVKVNISMRVPKALKLLPNPVLGAAGSALLKAVVSTTLPNFLNLLGDDYNRWLQSVQEEEDDDGEDMVVVVQGGSSKRDLNAPVGELFSPSSAL